MKVKRTMTVTDEVDARAIQVTVPVNYDDEDMPHDYPRRVGNSWTVVVDIDTGQIIGWPDGIPPRDIYMKVCDGGLYVLLDRTGGVLGTIDNDYVPACIPGEYGDYIDFKIDGSGRITNWKDKCRPDRVAKSFFEKGEQ